MKIKTPLMTVECEGLFLIVFFLFLLSIQVREFLNYYFLCYLVIIFHELSHVLIGVIIGKEIENFKFTLSGVCVTFKEKRFVTTNMIAKSEIIPEIILYLAGPISNVVLAILFYKIELIMGMNLLLAMINLVPIYPLDGYQILLRILKLFGFNQTLNIYIIHILNYVFFFILICFCIYQIIYFDNIAILLFPIYISLLKLNENNSKKMYNKC